VAPLSLDRGLDVPETVRSTTHLDRPVLIVNTHSRRGKDESIHARERLRSLGVSLTGYYALDRAAELHATVQKAISSGATLIILGGGDGSVSAVVDMLANSDGVLGLIPLGTANDFARTLGIPATVEEACTTIAHGVIIDVDLGMWGQNYYVNVASIGLGVEVTRALSPELKRRAGVLAYPLAAMGAFLAHRPFSATLTFPNGDHESETFDRLLQVAVGNGRFYGGGMTVAPRASIDDRILDVYTIELGRARDMFGVARYFKRGDFITNDCVHYYRTTSIEITTQPIRSINVDGEILGKVPARFTIAPKALKVMVPSISPAALLDAREARTFAP